MTPWRARKTSKNHRFFYVFWALQGVNMRPKTAKMRLKIAKMRPKMVKMRAKMFKMRPKMVKMRPKMPKMRAKMTKKRPEMAKMRPKTAKPQKTNGFSGFSGSPGRKKIIGGSASRVRVP